MGWVARVAGLAVMLAFSVTAQATDNAVMIVLPTGVLPSAVSSSGVIVGGLYSGGGFHWMPAGGAVYIGGLTASSVSRDGRVIVGDAAGANKIHQAAIWQRGSEWRLLGSISPTAQPCDASFSSALGSNGDGKVIVGLAWDGCKIARAFRWEESTGVVDLGSTVSGQSSRANAVSGDGKVVVGFQEHATGFWQGARWVDGKQTLFTGPDGLVGMAFAANADGSIVVGQVCRPGSGIEQSAWVWTTRGGTACLEPPRQRFGTFLGVAAATSDDGRVIGGTQTFGLEGEAVIWIDRHPYYLKDYLRDHGVPKAFDNWVNTGQITGVSRDGRTVIGFGAGPTGFTGYLVVLPGLGDLK